MVGTILFNTIISKDCVLVTQEGYRSVTLSNRRVLPRLILDGLHRSYFPRNNYSALSATRCGLWDEILFSWSTKTFTLPASFLFFSAAIPFLHCSSLNGYTIEASPSVAWGST